MQTHTKEKLTIRNKYSHKQACTSSKYWKGKIKLKKKKGCRVGGQ